jgi:hypothetical protein
MNLVKFKSSVLAQQCENIGEQVLNYQKYIDPIGIVRSNKGGWQSQFGVDGFPFYTQWSTYLFDFLTNKYIDYIEKFYNRQILVEPSRQSWITRAWFNINWPGDYNHEHNHLPSGADEFFYIPPEIQNDRELWLPMASGSFYITDSHNTFFVSKRSTIETTVEEEREYMDFKAGDTWIGDSSLVHGVSENKQNVPRITMSFNFEPKYE